MTVLPAPVELRMRTKVHPSELEQKQGKLVTAEDYNLLLTGPTLVRKPDGKPLCIYLPQWLAKEAADPEVYRVLHSLRVIQTKNRGLAGGTRRFPVSKVRTEAKPISSAIVGSMDPHATRRYCRLTRWTGDHLPEYELLRPMLQRIAEAFEHYVPDRFAAQMEAANSTNPAWVVPGTPFTTITVNNTYPTGVHTDRGDLAAGFSTLAVLRRGEYAGGVFVMPEFRVAVDMQDGDLLLMDAHEWHGNTAIEPLTEDAERISLVAYFRERMTTCGSPDEEQERAEREWERRATAREQQVLEDEEEVSA